MLTSLSVRPGFPDFLSLPWAHSLASWQPLQAPLEEMPIGLCRHIVRFVRCEDQLFALKQMPGSLALQEYNALRKLEELHLPAVQAVAHAELRGSDNGPDSENSLLITRYLDDAVPYRLLFIRPDFVHYREHLLDAMASLLVQLHLNGIFWGDCSLSNTLFRRDAGRLQAYLVDAETTEHHPSFSDALRQHELEIMNENITGALADLAAAGDLPTDFPIFETGESIQQRYQQLWDEVTRAESISPQQAYRIQERIQKLNRLGFSVDEVLLQSAAEPNRLRFRLLIADRYFHSQRLLELTGLNAEEHQAQRIISEIQALHLAQAADKTLAESAQDWLQTVWLPLQPALETLLAGMDLQVTEAYCLLQDHKWYLSEKAGQDIGNSQALADFQQEVWPNYLAGRCGDSAFLP